MQVKIYTNNFIPLTTLTTLTAIDVEQVQYTDTRDGDGTASFQIRADTKKVTKENIQVHNVVKIFDDGVLVFNGYITQVKYNINTLSINLVSIGYKLKNRQLGVSDALSGTLSYIVNQLLTATNTASQTGISIGSIEDDGTVYSKMFDAGQNIDQIIRDLIGADMQFRVDVNGKIQIATLLGRDLSTTHKLKYNSNQVENSNITNFDVKETSSSIITHILAKRTGSYVIVNDAELQEKYGLVQTTKTYSSALDNITLERDARKDLKGTLFTPELTLAPNFPDTFDVCDILGVAIYNKFIDIKEKYQVVEKSVTFIGTEKQIKIKLNDQQKNLGEILLDQKERIKLLENKQ